MGGKCLTYIGTEGRTHLAKEKTLGAGISFSLSILFIYYPYICLFVRLHSLAKSKMRDDNSDCFQ